MRLLLALLILAATLAVGACSNSSSSPSESIAPLPSTLESAPQAVSPEASPSAS